MLLAGMFFAFWRFMEIITLIPTLGMLAWFVNIYAGNDPPVLTPNYILILFIVSVLGAVWAIATLFTYHRDKSSALFVSFIDLCFVGAFIGAVYELRMIQSYDCTHVSRNGTPFFSVSAGGSGFSLSGIDVNTDKTCAMLKASWAFGIMNCIFFAFTSFLALMVGRSSHRGKEAYVTETHYSRHGHRRSGSHRSHRSSHSNSGRRRAYV